MRLVTFADNSEERIGVFDPESDTVIDLAQADPSLPRDMNAFIDVGSEGLHCLDVSGATGRDLTVGGIFQSAAGVAGNRTDHAGDTVKIGFNAPETPAGEGCNPKIPLGGTGYGGFAHRENKKQQGRNNYRV